MFVWRRYYPWKVVVSDEVLEARKHRHVDDTSQAPSIISRGTEDVTDGRLRDDDARETCVPGPKSLFVEKCIVVLREGDLNWADVRSFDPCLPED